MHKRTKKTHVHMQTCPQEFYRSSLLKFRLHSLLEQNLLTQIMKLYKGSDRKTVSLQGSALSKLHSLIFLFIQSQPPTFFSSQSHVSYTRKVFFLSLLSFSCHFRNTTTSFTSSTADAWSSLIKTLQSEVHFH